MKMALNAFTRMNKDDTKYLVFVQYTKFKLTVLTAPNIGRSGGTLPTLH